MLGVISLTCAVNGRGATVGTALAAAHDLDALWEATAAGSGLTATTAADLLRNGQPELLIGQAENVWLEVKSEPYKLRKNELQKFELAKDVAALGNTPDGGLLVIGLATTKRAGIDTISAVRPVPVEMVSSESYRDTINAHIYPPPAGLTVELLPMHGETALLLTSVPAQPPENLPLMVVGARVADRVLSTHASIPTRVGDETILTHPAGIHSLLVAGRAALARDLAHRQAGDETGN